MSNTLEYQKSIILWFVLWQENDAQQKRKSNTNFVNLEQQIKKAYKTYMAEISKYY